MPSELAPRPATRAGVLRPRKPGTVGMYLRLIGVSVRGQMQYRGTFLVMSLGQLLTHSLEPFAIWALFDRFGSLAVWTLPQVALLYGTVSVSFAFTDALARGFDLFGDQFIKTGNFDRILLRPRPLVPQVAGHEFTLFRVGRLIPGLVVLVWALWSLDIDWNAARVLLLALSLASTFLFFYGLIILQATLAFWTTETLHIFNLLTYGGVETAQYPLAIYARDFRRFFTFVVPLGCVTYFPLVGVMGVQDPLGSTPWMQFTAPLAGFAFFGVALLVWRTGVRHYTSTGS